jgi:hypothetical protein
MFIHASCLFMLGGLDVNLLMLTHGFYSCLWLITSLSSVPFVSACNQNIFVIFCHVVSVLC